MGRSTFLWGSCRARGRGRRISISNDSSNSNNKGKRSKNRSRRLYWTATPGTSSGQNLSTYHLEFSQKRNLTNWITHPGTLEAASTTVPAQQSCAACSSYFWSRSTWASEYTDRRSTSPSTGSRRIATTRRTKKAATDKIHQIVRTKKKKAAMKRTPQRTHRANNKKESKLIWTSWLSVPRWTRSARLAHREPNSKTLAGHLCKMSRMNRTRTNNKFRKGMESGQRSKKMYREK